MLTYSSKTESTSSLDTCSCSFASVNAGTFHSEIDITTTKNGQRLKGLKKKDI